MNIVMIMSGGVGRRLGADIPKQYLKIKDKCVLDYVIEEVLKSKKTDKIVIVMDKSFIDYSKYIKNNPDILLADNGKERLDSLQNGFNRIKEIGGCDKILICDGVAPMITGKLIDNYFDLLNDNDVVITCQKITGALGNYNYDPLDREDYYMTQSPEAFKFDMLLKYFKTDFKSQELAWQLPRETKKYLNFDFKNNIKLTYGYELNVLESMLEEKNK